MAQRAQLVDAGMAGGAQGDQPATVMDSGMTVVHRQRPLRHAAARQRRPSRSKIWVAVAGKAATRTASRQYEPHSPEQKEPESPAGTENGSAHAGKSLAKVAAAGPAKLVYQRASGER